MSIESKLAELSRINKFPMRLSKDELEFVAAMRNSAARGVGYGMMQQLIEWEWQGKAIGSWGVEYFTLKIREKNKEIEELKALLAKKT